MSCAVRYLITVACISGADILVPYEMKMHDCTVAKKVRGHNSQEQVYAQDYRWHECQNKNNDYRVFKSGDGQAEGTDHAKHRQCLWNGTGLPSKAAYHRKKQIGLIQQPNHGHDDTSAKRYDNYLFPIVTRIGKASNPGPLEDLNHHNRVTSTDGMTDEQHSFLCRALAARERKSFERKVDRLTTAYNNIE